MLTVAGQIKGPRRFAAPSRFSHHDSLSEALVEMRELIALGLIVEAFVTPVGAAATKNHVYFASMPVSLGQFNREGGLLLGPGRDADGR